MHKANIVKANAPMTAYLALFMANVMASHRPGAAGLAQPNRESAENAGEAPGAGRPEPPKSPAQLSNRRAALRLFCPAPRLLCSVPKASHMPRPRLDEIA